MTIADSFKAVQTIAVNITANVANLNTRLKTLAADVAALTPSGPPTPSPDTQAPSVPATLSAVAVSPNQVDLSWGASTDNVGVVGYRVYLNDMKLADVPGLAYQHMGLTPGSTYSYRVSAYDAVPNHSAWTGPVSVTTPGVAPAPLPVPSGTARTFVLSDFIVQARMSSRVSIVTTDRGPAMRLHTEPGDTNIDGSGNMRRCDLYLPTEWGEGVEQWWAHAVMLPDDFSYPAKLSDFWEMYVLMDFHNSSTGPFQANLHLNFDNNPPGSLTFRGFGGQSNMAGPYGGLVGPLPKNTWLDVVYHVRWSSGADGFAHAWVNGEKKLTHVGATLYAGQRVYLKLANYHNPVYEPFVDGVDNGPPSSVIHAYPVKADTLADLGWALDAAQRLVKL